MKLVKEQNISSTTKRPRSVSNSSCAEKGRKRPCNKRHSHLICCTSMYGTASYRWRQWKVTRWDLGKGDRDCLIKETVSYRSDLQYAAISRKVVGKSARDNPERYCVWFWAHCSSKKFERMAREVMDVCLRELKESNKSRFESYSVRKSVLIIFHNTFRDCSVDIFSDNFSSRNSCKLREMISGTQVGDR